MVKWGQILARTDQAVLWVPERAAIKGVRGYMDQLYLVGFLGAAAAILFAWLQSRRVLSFSEGSDAMKKIAAAIRSGANAYLKHQYTTVAKVFLVVFVLLLVTLLKRCWPTPRSTS